MAARRPKETPKRLGVGASCATTSSGGAASGSQKPNSYLRNAGASEVSGVAALTELSNLSDKGLVAAMLMGTKRHKPMHARQSMWQVSSGNIDKHMPARVLFALMSKKYWSEEKSSRSF